MANGSGIVGTVQPNGNAAHFLAGDLSWRSPAIDLSIMWPVGSIYMSMVSTNPAQLFGFGTWVAVAAGRVLVGIDAGQSGFDVLGETGGAKTHTLSTAELPAHAHTQQAQGGTTGSNTGTHVMTSTATGGSLRSSAQSTVAAGSGTAHNNLQPYLVVSIWQRAA